MESNLVYSTITRNELWIGGLNPHSHAKKIKLIGIDQLQMNFDLWQLQIKIKIYK